MSSFASPNGNYGSNEKHKLDSLNSKTALPSRDDENVTVAETENSKFDGNINKLNFNNYSNHGSSSNNSTVMNGSIFSPSSKTNSDGVTNSTSATDEDCNRDVGRKRGINKYNIYNHPSSSCNLSDDNFYSCMATPETPNESLRSLDMKYSKSDTSSHSPRRLLDTPEITSDRTEDSSPLNDLDEEKENDNGKHNIHKRNHNNENKNVCSTQEEATDANPTFTELRTSPLSSLRARLDSEEQYRALAASHAATNPHLAFFSVQQNKSSTGPQESPNNSGSILYVNEDDSLVNDQNHQGYPSNHNMNAQNSSRFFSSNRDRMSSTDSNGSLVFTKINHYNNNHKHVQPSDRFSNRPPVATTSFNRNSDSQPEQPTEPQLLPYHKRKLLAERQKEKETAETPTNKSKINKTNDNHNNNNKVSNNASYNNTSIKKQNKATAKNGYKMKRPSELTTISSTPPIPPSNHNNRSNKIQQQQKQPSNHKRMMSTDSSDNASSEFSSPDKDMNAEYSKPFYKAGPPLHPSSRNNVNDHNQSSQLYNEHHFPSSSPNQTLTAGYHVRADSGGSISSLGSHTGGAGSVAPIAGRSLTDRLGKEIRSFLQGSSSVNNDAIASSHLQHQHQHRSLSSFMSGIMDDNFSPRSATTLEDTKADFHEKNQAFLQKAEQQRFKRNAVLSDRGTAANTRRVIRSRSPRPPNVQGAHRPGLSSIDNDNWEEDVQDKNGEGDEKIPHSHRGRTQKNKPTYKNKVREADLTHDVGPSVDYDNYHDRNENLNRNYGSTTSNRDPRRRNDDHLRRTMKKSNRSAPKAYKTNDEVNYQTMRNISRPSVSESSESDSQSSVDRNFEETNEQTKLLPPSGISTYESREYSRNNRESRFVERENHRSSHLVQKHRDGSKRENKKSRQKERYEREKEEFRRWEEYKKKKKRRKKREKRSRTRQHENIHYSHSHEYSTEDESLSDDEKEYRNWLKLRTKELMNQERKKFIEYWKAEAEAQIEAQRKEEERNRWYKKFGHVVSEKYSQCTKSIQKSLSTAETFISNLPLVIGAVALAIVTLGVVWFKFAEENLDTCKPVHFHSSQCSFPEFPGCFFCDTSVTMYEVAVYFHYTCSTIAGLLAMLFFAKVILARQIVMDEMSSPTTSSPAGLICMTMVCVFAGRGWIGQMLVTLAACMHLCLAAWFVYLALAYNIMPEPSWYPNTVGIGLSAVKTWLYYPVPGHFLMAISLSLNIFFFPLSLVRVSLNQKISAPVCWIQMSAPAVALYALTIMAQPSFEEESPDMTQFQRIHRSVYMPIMHFLFINSVIGVVSSFHSLKTRWYSFSKKEFSPAHAAFCFPTLAHANAVQAYRGAINTFSNIPPHSPVKIAIYIYWVIFLVGGTIATIIITTKFFRKLPSWTIFDIAGEIEPPAPNQTVMSEVILIGEHVKQNYVSPAVLQANETGQLIRHRDADGRARYVRTRQITALGFEPIMNQIELQEERDALLEWVARNPPRTRKRTLSVPGIDFSSRVGADFGTGNSGVWYDVESRGFRERAYTADNNNRRNKRGSTMHN